MIQTLNLGIVFNALAVIFIGLAFRDYLKTENKITPARKTWLHIAFIFSGGGIFLYVLRLFTE